jgi:hypothetical protein
MNPLGRYFTLAVICVAGLAFAAAAPEQPAFHYIGAKKCKTCHNSSKKGAQYKAWMKTKHAEAYATLATPEALELAAEKGIEDPQKADECLECHVTGHGEPAEHFAKTFDATLGVQCESCHGAGSGYYKKKQMKEITAGKVKPETYGLVIPTAETCAQCHNERSPSGEFVDWAADSATIAHPYPAGALGGDEDEDEEEEDES